MCWQDFLCAETETVAPVEAVWRVFEELCLCVCFDSAGQAAVQKGRGPRQRGAWRAPGGRRAPAPGW